jgi:nitrogen regulatory protein P-II 1
VILGLYDIRLGGLRVKKVEALIKPFKLEDVKRALHKVGIHGMTVSEVRGFGRQKGHKEQYRGAEYTLELIPKTKIEVIVTADQEEPVVKAIANAARTGEIGDGKIVVYDLGTVMRIRTGELGEAAV